MYSNTMFTLIKLLQRRISLCPWEPQNLATWTSRQSPLNWQPPRAMQTIRPSNRSTETRKNLARTSDSFQLRLSVLSLCCLESPACLSACLAGSFRSGHDRPGTNCVACWELGEVCLPTVWSNSRCTG